LYITLRDAEGTVVRGIRDPFGGTFDASGDFDEFLGRGRAPLLDSIDPDGETALDASLMPVVAKEVDALLATVPEDAKARKGRAGTAWRGLVRFRAMADVCASDSRYTLNFTGD